MAFSDNVYSETEQEIISTFIHSAAYSFFSSNCCSNKVQCNKLKIKQQLREREEPREQRKFSDYPAVVACFDRT